MNEKLLTHRRRDKKLKKPIPEFCRLYATTIEGNLRAISKVLDETQISSLSVDQFKDMLERSSQNLMDKWNSGRKSLRTEIAYKVLPEYPPNILPASLTIDSIINLLDDFLDELMTKREKALYVIELVRNLAVFNQHGISSESRRKISEYFNKILCIGITEILYEGKIRASDDFSQRLHYSIQCYNCKSLVTDIFFELPLVELYGNDRRIKDIVSLARTHRALFQIKKDYKDIARDIKNKTETPLVILSGEGKELLKNYMDAMMGRYERASKKLDTKGFDGDFQVIAERLQGLISKEIAEYREEGFYE